jgi:hypothetical protein
MKNFAMEDYGNIYVGTKEKKKNAYKRFSSGGESACFIVF